MKKISVVIPVYNVAEFLPTCLDSLVHQTFPSQDYEVLLVDDGSTDNSAQICQQYIERYPQLLRLLTKKNGGLSDARNYGLARCQGNYVLFIDSDDYVEKQMLARMYTLTDQETKKIVECNFIWEYPNRQRLDLRSGYQSVADYLINGRVVAWNKLYRRDWLLQTKVEFPKGKLYEDQNFFFKIILFLDNINEIALDQTAEVHYRQRSGSISYNQASKITDIFWIYQDLIDYYQLHQGDRYYAEIQYRFCRNLLGNVLLRKIRPLKNRQQKQTLTTQIWQKIDAWFPDWKENPYLKRPGKVNSYLRLVKPFWTKLLVTI
ncbi:glycosyltransferase family 2 protein [Liquorilactobacillus nagelii]|jgi:glycosyltransferase involved in cell wall biosynthesis|uniref:glycosyltransferase family 2 protein n=1 Tax=Liquorilactobacillus nagelii TaxID=82688 RepID=UPI0006EE75E9|nr:glycosyltransferase [Liquorilactobacillus nagelii]KRL40864.1 glycosyltransferase [Liquorilactobacillus nagelii DSM 13675]QYH53827.1 glycosyltransferase [Liquorilactobacillus nagelii DSM 13675]ULQ50303.1 glycosyltransferase [Liquorilactobacillus nagelii]